MGGIETVGSREEELVLDVIRRKKIFRYAFNDQEVAASYVYRLEKMFREFIGAGYSLAVSSGTAALRTCLAALGIKPGDEVIVPAYTFVATLEAVIESGAQPVLVEIDDSFNINPAQIEKKITAKTRAIMPVHMMGSAVAMDAIQAIAKKHNLFVVEDACQGIGAKYRGKFTGTLGRISAFSFDSAKLLTCSEGGMIATNDAELYRKADRFHDHGHVHNLSLPRGKEPKEGGGVNFRLSEILAAFGLAQMERLPKMLESLRCNRSRIKDGLKLPAGFVFRRFNDPEDAATFLAILAPNQVRADKVKEGLMKAGITPATLNYWHYQANRELVGGSYPATEDYLGRAIVLDIKVKMDDGQTAQIISGLNESLVTGASIK